MTLRAIVEVAVDLNHLRNLDLIHQGVYRLNISVFYVKEGHRFVANPNMIQEYEGDYNKNAAKRPEHDISDGEILDRENSFSSRAMLIRYSEQKANIRQIVHFRTEVDVTEGYFETEFYVEARLQFWDMMDVEGPENWRHALPLRQQLKMTELAKIISTKQYRVSNILRGTSQHLPIIFDGLHQCYVVASIHSALIDYRFRLKSPLTHDFESFRQNGLVVEPHVPISNNKKEIKSMAKAAKEATQNAQNFIMKGIKQAATALQEQTESQSPFQMFEKQEDAPLAVFSPKTISEYFFADECGVIPKVVKKEQINLIYYDYIKALYSVHQQLREHMNKWFARLYENYGRDVISAREALEREKEKEEIEPLLKPITEILPEYVVYGIKEALLGKNPRDDVRYAKKALPVIASEKAEEEEEESKEQSRPASHFASEIWSSSDLDTNPTIGAQDIKIENIDLQESKSEGEGDGEAAVDDLGPEEVQQAETLILASVDCDLGVMQLKERSPAQLKLPRLDGRGDKSFAEWIETSVANEASALILSDINKVGGQLFQMWYKWVDMLKRHGDEINDALRADYDKRVYERYLESIFKSVNTTPNLGYCGRARLGEMHKNVAKERRTNIVYRTMPDLPVHDVQFFAPADQHPILFEELYSQESAGSDDFALMQENLQQALQVSVANSDYKGSHLFVLVHGFQGNAFDMRVFKACIASRIPDALFHASQVNEGIQDGDIMEMGMRLAQDVKQYVNEWCPGSELSRLSFIGHSLGGLVIRAALPLLSEFKTKMHLYMSLSSPHLGYSFNSNGLVRFGLWVMKKFKKNTIMKQLTLTDGKTAEKCTLYKLSEAEGLEWFKHVALMSSYQDRYVPFESSRIEVSSKIDRSRQGQVACFISRKGVLYRKMVGNIFNPGKFRGKSVYRLDVNFKIQDKNLDSWIGRAAHILFLENYSFIRMVVSRYKAFFS